MAQFPLLDLAKRLQSDWHVVSADCSQDFRHQLEVMEMELSGADGHEVMQARETLGMNRDSRKTELKARIVAHMEHTLQHPHRESPALGLRSPLKHRLEGAAESPRKRRKAANTRDASTTPKSPMATSLQAASVIAMSDALADAPPTPPFCAARSPQCLPPLGDQASASQYPQQSATAPYESAVPASFPLEPEPEVQPLFIPSGLAQGAPEAASSAAPWPGSTQMPGSTHMSLAASPPRTIVKTPGKTPGRNIAEKMKMFECPQASAKPVRAAQGGTPRKQGGAVVCANASRGTGSQLRTNVDSLTGQLEAPRTVAASPRPGGLLDKMRQRGTLTPAGLSSPLSGVPGASGPTPARTGNPHTNSDRVKAGFGTADAGAQVAPASKEAAAAPMTEVHPAPKAKSRARHASSVMPMEVCCEPATKPPTPDAEMEVATPEKPQPLGPPPSRMPHENGEACVARVAMQTSMSETALPQVKASDDPMSFNFSNLLSASTGSLLTPGLRGPDGRPFGCKHADARSAREAEAIDRLTEGRRRDDVTKPHSLRVAEQRKLQEEKRLREKKETQKHRWAANGAEPAPSPSSSTRLPELAAAEKKQARAKAGATRKPVAGDVCDTTQEVDMEVATPYRSACGDGERSAAPPRGSPLGGDKRSGKKPRPPVPSFKQEPPWMELRRIPLGSKKEEDNYEISDKDENSEGENDRDRSHKRIPRWCDDYVQRLSQQAHIDPDCIFGSQVPRCDLTAIFTDEDYKKRGKDRPKRKRGSSGEWKKDRLTQTEISEYKSKMGQTGSIRVNAENLSANVGAGTPVTAA